MKYLIIFAIITSCAPIKKDVAPKEKIVILEGVKYLAKLGDDGDYCLTETP